MVAHVVKGTLAARVYSLAETYNSVFAYTWVGKIRQAEPSIHQSAEHLALDYKYYLDYLPGASLFDLLDQL